MGELSPNTQRAQALAQIDAQSWDLVVIGGGISGAGVAQQAARRGWKVVLVEQHDFAWGTSSRSSKLVHGGLRYLKEGDVKTTWHSVRERERLMHEAPQLIEPQSIRPIRQRPLRRFVDLYKHSIHPRGDGCSGESLDELRLPA